MKKKKEKNLFAKKEKKEKEKETNKDLFTKKGEEKKEKRKKRMNIFWTSLNKSHT